MNCRHLEHDIQLQEHFSMDCTLWCCFNGVWSRLPCNISRCAQENNQQTTDLHQVDLKPNVNIHNIHMNHRHTHTNGDKDRNSWHDIANIFTLDHGPTRSAFLKNPPRHAWKISSRDFWRKPAHRGDPHRKTDNGCGFYGKIWGHFMTFRNGNCCVVVCFFCI